MRKRSLAIVLCVLMVLTLMPVSSFAADYGRLDGPIANKATAKLLYVAPKAGANITDSTKKLEEKFDVTTPSDELKAGDAFYVAVKLCDMANIPGADKGIHGTTMRIKYDKNVVRFEGANAANGDNKNRVGTKGTLYETQFDDDDNEMYYGMEISVDTSSGVVTCPLVFNSTTLVPTYKGATDEYIAVLAFSVKATPAGNSKPVSFSLDRQLTAGTNVNGVDNYAYLGTGKGDNFEYVMGFNDDAVKFPGEVQSLAGTTTITGTATYGQTLNASFSVDGSITDWGTKTATFNWYREGVTNPIGTGADYKLTLADVGKKIKVAASHADYKGTVESAETAAVGKITLNAPSSITVTKSVNMGATNKQVTDNYKFVAADGIINNDVVTAAYTATYDNVSAQGTVNDVTVVLGSTLTGAGAAGYTFAGATLNNQQGTVASLPTIAGSVNISGNAVYGSKLTASATVSGAGTLSYEWFRDGSSIGTGAEYTLGKADVGKAITVKVSDTNHSGTLDKATANVAKKTLTAPASVSGVSTSKGNATANGSYTFVAANGIVGSDVVTTTYVATFADASQENNNADVSVVLSAALGGADSAYYEFGGATINQKGAVLGQIIQSITAINWTDTTYTFGDKLKLNTLKASGTYANGDSFTDLPYDELVKQGVAFTKEGTAVADEVIVNVTDWNGKKITVTKDASSQDTDALTVNPATTTLAFVKSMLSQTVGSVKILGMVTATPADNQTIKIEIKEVTPAVEGHDCAHAQNDPNCTSKDADGNCTHAAEDNCGYVAAVPAGENWVTLDAAKAAALKEGSYDVRATSEAGDNTTAVTTPVVATLKVNKKSSGGGGGGGSVVTDYTVKFSAGDHGKLEGKLSVTVAKDGNVKSADIPKVTPDEGYVFAGWTLDGKTTVDPTAAKVTANVNYTALYKASKGTHGTFMSGYTDGTFRPDGNTTRAEVASLMAGLIEGYDKNATYTTSLNDIDNNEWYAQAVKFMSAQGLITGYDDGSFRPGRQITRQEFCAIIAKYLDLKNEGTTDFSDVADAWGQGFIAQLATKGIVSGYPDGSFMPDKAITRAEVTTILNKVFDRVPDQKLVDENIGNYTVRMSDVTKDHWAYYQILEAAMEHEVADFH